MHTRTAATAAAAAAGDDRTGADTTNSASGPTTAERVAAQRPVDQARIAVKQAQAAYDLVHNDPHIGALPEAAALEQATAAARLSAGGLQRRNPGRDAAAVGCSEGAGERRQDPSDGRTR